TGPFDEIILVGHSLGGLLVRQAYLFANGLDPLDSEPRDWTGAVKRILLFASVNRGVNIIDPEGRFSLRLKLLRLAFRYLPFLRKLLVYDLMRGSNFITNLRIQWIRFFDSLDDQAPLIVLLLGTNDGLVKRDDDI